MRQWVASRPAPASMQTAAAIIYDAFRSAVGVDLLDPRVPDEVYRPDFDDGGMSGGVVAVAEWRRRFIPMLEERAATLFEPGQWRLNLPAEPVALWDEVIRAWLDERTPTAETLWPWFSCYSADGPAAPNLEALPEPWFGRWDAPAMVFLALNPGQASDLPG